MSFNFDGADWLSSGDQTGDTNNGMLNSSGNWVDPSSLGYSGTNPWNLSPTIGENDSANPEYNQALQQYQGWLSDQGLTPATAFGGGNTQWQQYFNQQGKPVGPMAGISLNDPNFALASAAAQAVLGNANGLGGDGMDFTNSGSFDPSSSFDEYGFNTNGYTGPGINDFAVPMQTFGAFTPLLKGVGLPTPSSGVSNLPSSSGENMDWGNMLGTGLKGLAGLYQYNQSQKGYDNMLSSLQSLYSPNSPYAQQLRQQLDRRDAAAGRRSQYGPREVELQAQLARMASSQIPAMTQLQNMSIMNRNTAINGGLQMLQRSGLLNKAGGYLQGLFGSDNDSGSNFSMPSFDSTNYGNGIDYQMPSAGMWNFDLGNNQGYDFGSGLSGLWGG